MIKKLQVGMAELEFDKYIEKINEENKPSELIKLGES